MAGIKYILSITLYIFLATYLAVSSFAVAPIPNFPSCPNPQGTLIVEYDSGIHGIAGSTAQYQGSDKVYRVDPDTLTQCFCSENGEGIQTNWWKISSLTDSEAEELINAGWTYIPNGALWGLQATPYFAKNSNFSCSSSNANENNQSNSGGTDGQVLGASTGEVLGLASTGDIVLLLDVFALGILTILSGIVLYRKRRNR